jgi:hypothetical protein
VDPGNGPGGTAAVPVDDVVEALNSFELFDTVLDDLHQPLTAEMLKRYHGILKRGTAQSLDPRFAVGAFKALPNALGLTPTTPPEHVELAIAELLEHAPRDLEGIAAFHHRFESIHPFADGNGRIGRVAMFKQTLEAGIAPFVILDQAKAFYYRGLSEFSTEPGFLIGTLESMQDNYAEVAAPLAAKLALAPRSWTAIDRSTGQQIVLIKAVLSNCIEWRPPLRALDRAAYGPTPSTSTSTPSAKRYGPAASRPPRCLRNREISARTVTVRPGSPNSATAI